MEMDKQNKTCMLSQQADGCLGLYVMTEDRVKIMDVTAEIWQEPYALIVPAPQEASRLLSFIKPWQSSVNCCIVRMLLLFF